MGLVVVVVVGVVVVVAVVVAVVVLFVVVAVVVVGVVVVVLVVVVVVGGEDVMVEVGVMVEDVAVVLDTLVELVVVVVPDVGSAVPAGPTVALSAGCPAGGEDFTDGSKRNAASKTNNHRRVSTQSINYHFAVGGPVAWNSLPVALRSSDVTGETFGRQLKTFLFNYLDN